MLLSGILSDSRPDAVLLLSDPSHGVIGSFSSDDDDFPSPASVFSYFFDEEMVDTLCHWINERANKYKEDFPEKNTIHGLMWKNVNRSELHVFFS